MDIQKLYDNISYDAILDSIDMLHLPMLVRQFVQSFLQDRTFVIRLQGKAVGTFDPVRGVPQGSVLAPTLFIMDLIPLAWRLYDVPDVKFLIYADDITVWSTHRDLEIHASSLESALDVTAAFDSSVGLQLSIGKTYTSVANRWGRRKLAACPIRLQLAGQPLQESTQSKSWG